MSGAAAHARLVDRCGERMARCLLTYCIDGADALMMALLKGAPHALAVFTLLVEGLDGHDDAERRHAERALDHLFSQGAARWGCHVNPKDYRPSTAPLHAGVPACSPSPHGSMTH